jgi:hypothetical protein
MTAFDQCLKNEDIGCTGLDRSNVFTRKISLPLFQALVYLFLYPVVRFELYILI